MRANVGRATSSTGRRAKISTSVQPIITHASTALARTRSARSCARANPVITSTTTTTRATVRPHAFNNGGLMTRLR